MMFGTLCEIDRLVKKYAKAYAISNNTDLNVIVVANINEENKEFLLNDLDYTLRDLINFSHKYKNGQIEIIFKELI